MINCSGKAKIKHSDTGEIYEIDSDSLVFEESERSEGGMGSRITYTADFEHDQLGELSWSLWEYPVGTENHRETNVGGHVIIEDIMFDLEKEGGFDLPEEDFVPPEKDFAPPEEESSDNNNDPTKLADELNTIISRISEPLGYPLFGFGDDNLLHMVIPLDQHAVTGNTELLEELRKAASKLKNALASTNFHIVLKDVVDAYYDALSKDEISITELYACGVRLYNADQKIKREIQKDESPPLPLEASIDLGTVQDLHGSYIMADEHGRKLVQDASEYNTSAQQAKELKQVNQEIATTIDQTPTLFGKDVREHVSTVVNDVGKGPAPERSNQVATTTITNIVIGILKRFSDRAIDRSIDIALFSSVPIVTAIGGSIELANSWTFLIEIIPHLEVFASHSMSKLPSLKAVSDALKRISNLNKWRPKQKNKADVMKDDSDKNKNSPSHKNSTKNEKINDLTARSKQGDAEAQYRLGVMYDYGDGVPQDHKVAAEWYTLAAEQDHAQAQYNLGTLYYGGNGVLKDDVTAVKWFTLAAEQGLADAQYNLGTLYYGGNGVLRDDVTAVKWFTLAAEQGLADAQFNLGVMYYDGDGVLKDDVTAVKWFTLAAEQGFATAQNNLGGIYLEDVGTPKDEKSAKKWFTLAAKQGLADAQANLGLIYDYGKGVPQDYKKAIKWYRLAEKQGHVGAQFNLGVMYEEGKGVRKNYKTAVESLTRAAEQGSAKAQSNLGGMYYNGKGVLKDDKEAVKWFTLAAKQDLAEAHFNLGVMYNSGYGISKDDREAVKRFALAAKQGHAEAQSNLGISYYTGKGILKDNVSALMWLIVAASNENKIAIKAGKDISKEMTPREVVEAEERALACVKSGYKNCGP